MYDGYHYLMRGFALKSLLKNPEMPKTNLAISNDDEMSDVPLLIFKDQHAPLPVPVYPKVTDLTYEGTALNGSGDTLSLDNFVTDDFNIGVPYDTP